MANRSAQLAAARASEVAGYELHTSRPDIGLEVYTKEVGGAYGIIAKGFLGKAGKPAWFYQFRTDAEFAAYLERAVASREKSLEAKAKIRAERAAAPAVPVAVGDVFRCSWGYDQTNIDYYQVTRVVSDKSVEVRKIGAVAWDEGWLQGRSVPALDSFIGRPMVKRLQSYGDEVGIRIASYAHAYRMDPVVEGVPAYGSSHWTAYH